MDDQNYDIPSEEDGVQESLQNAGNKIQNGVSNFGRGVVNGVNSGLQSSKKPLDNKDKPDIPEKKDQNNNTQKNPNNPINKAKEKINDAKSNYNNFKNELNEKNPLTKAKNKVNDLKEKINEKNPINNLKKKINEKNPLNKLKNKIDDKLNPTKLVLQKVKFIVSIAAIVGILLIIFIIAIIGGTVVQTTLHNITEDFTCSMEDIFYDGTWSVSRTYGWYLVDTGEVEVVEIEEEVDGKIIKKKASLPIYEAIFNDGIDINVNEGTKIFAAQPGTITDINDNYIEINHNLNNENSFNNKTYKTKYYNYGTLFKDIKVDDLVVKQTTLSLSGTKTLNFQVFEEENSVDTNLFFGYEAANNVCGDKNSITSTRGTERDHDIKLLMENDCNGMTKNIGRKDGINKICAINNYGTPSGEYTSLICGSQSINAKGPGTAQCAAGVYGYYNSFLPTLDSVAWSRFDLIRGNAIDYWTRNVALGNNSFKTDQNPTPGSLWVSSYSRAMCGNASCGHIMSVISVENDNVKVFECNYDGKESCWYHTYTKSELSSKRGFLGYIHILGEC